MLARLARRKVAKSGGAGMTARGFNNVRISPSSNFGSIRVMAKSDHA
jgi:hypothetical protein